jgi:hypothetical protein
MSDSLVPALIGALGAILGSLVTAFASNRSAANAQRAERERLRTISRDRDIIAFHQLERRYTEALATPEKNLESWRRQIRKQQIEEGGMTPELSELEAKKEIQRLSGN